MNCFVPLDKSGTMAKKITSSLRTIGKILEWMVFGMLIILYLIVLSPNLPTKKYVSTYIVQTGSMEPTIHTGSIALIRQINADQIKKGDIIIFTSPKDPNQTILHRVFEVKQKDKNIEFEMKGDNNTAPDNWMIPAVSIKGICFSTIPFLGHPAAFLKTQKGFIILIGIPALFLIILQIKKIREGIDEEVQRRIHKQIKKEKTTDVITGIGILLLASLTGLLSIQAVRALFISKATASGITFSVKDFTPPTTTVFIQGDLDETKNIVGTGGWHGYGWYERYDNVNLRIQTGDPFTHTINYQLLSGDVACPVASDISYVTGLAHDTNIENVVNVRTNGIHTLCYFGTNPPAFSEAVAHKQLLKLDRENPAFVITGASGTYSDGVYYNNSPTVSATVSPADGFSGYTRGRFDLTYADAGHNCTTPVPSGVIPGYPGYNEDNLLPPHLSPTRTLTQTNIPDGNWCFRIWVYDDVQNKSGYQDVSFTVDTSIPTASLSVTGSWTKKVEENIDNGGFESGGTTDWKTAGNVTTIASDTIGTTPITPTGTAMARIGQTSGSSGNYAWENRLMQSIPAGAKSLSLFYNFLTRDYFLDDPGFFIRLNGKDIFHTSAWMADTLVDPFDSVYSTGWTQWYYDLSTITDPFINLSISAGNTGDQDVQSWVYIDQVTTYVVAAPSHAQYSFTGTDTGTGISKFYYNIDSAVDYTLYTTPFKIEDNGPHTLHYYSEDGAGNHSSIYTTKIVTDAQPPTTPADFAVFDMTTSGATLTWTAPGDDGMAGRAASYDLRYSTSPITDENFDEASKSGTLSSPTLSGYTEQAFIEGLNPDTHYFFALKVFDEAPNASDIATTDGITLEDETESDALPGDVVINELMWTGSSQSASDEWVELRNMTDRSINLAGWKLQKFKTLLEDEDMYVFPSDNPTVTTIAPRDYMVISRYSADSSVLKHTGLVAGSGFTLNNTTLRITLVDTTNIPIDAAWDGSEPPEAYYHHDVYYYSMERMEIPGNGFEKIRWYPCIDEASKTEFFDGALSIDYGTPGAKNRSENEPLVYEFLKRATTSAILAATENEVTVAGVMTNEPSVKLTYDEKTHVVSFTATSIQSFISLSWELSYETDASTSSGSEGMPQGVVGKAELDGTNEYKKTTILLGTCSTGGACVYHTGAKNLKLKIILINEDNQETVLEKTL
ncbi:MAG: Fibronectin type III domain-containing protein [Candidatus Gottesmanbacteria bacterium GW2011_GWB1_44_11c]|uniref:Signal peptidase I n=2 Tax=Candidatus Gottesmaniibacteriota TaxID=1752720 RepID=A0A0G1KXK3_9BACT|nr:MAG: Fibronectin type III domain-containing protein [Candidatus Gottesmanbacteria bacterium GW2011_GWB1_44_11c]KKT61052.1 MAG: Fibronectin type III domain-containing protein [Candidatus Gottesmanbacteria bacterium GW2011_GWA1_44_24b]